VVFNDFIKDDFVPKGDGQVASGSVLKGGWSPHDREIPLRIDIVP
jgi:hypothetical protein